MRTYESIEQTKFLRGKKIIEIKNNNQVRVSFKSFSGSNEETFNLFDISHDTDKYFNRPIGFLITGCTITLITLILLVASIDKPSNIYGTIPFFIIAIICFYQYYFKLVDIIVYRFRGNGQVAFSLWNNNPNSNDLNAFTDILSEKIKSLKIRPGLDNIKKLEIYKDSLEFLLDEEVIFQEEASAIYDRIKEKLTGEDKAKLYSITPKSE
jgi:hypothetical protein